MDINNTEERALELFERFEQVAKSKFNEGLQWSDMLVVNMHLGSGELEYYICIAGGTDFEGKKMCGINREKIFAPGIYEAFYGGWYGPAGRLTKNNFLESLKRRSNLYNIDYLSIFVSKAERFLETD